MNLRMSHSSAGADSKSFNPFPQSSVSPAYKRSVQSFSSSSENSSILIVTHKLHSTPGEVGRILSGWGYDLDIRCPAEGDRLPDTMDEHEGVVIFGGPMSANDDDSLEFIKAELDWIPTVLEADKPFLGICLGAQLLARSLGASVTPHPQSKVEVGYYPIYATDEGNSLFDSLAYVYHWHKEGFELPADAQLLATGEAFPNQAFQYGSCAYGFQFHPEITLSMITKWTSDAADHLVHPGAQVRDHHFQYHDKHASKTSQWLTQFLAQWLRREERTLTQS